MFEKREALNYLPFILLRVGMFFRVLEGDAFSFPPKRAVEAFCNEGFLVRPVYSLSLLLMPHQKKIIASSTL